MAQALPTPPVLVLPVSSRLWGGMERYALDIASHFSSRGWDVMAYTRDVRIIDSMFARAGIKVCHAPLAGYFDLSTTMSMARRLRRSGARPVVIHAGHYRDAFAALLARKLARMTARQVRVVCTHHHCHPARDGRLMRRIYRNLDALIFVSSFARRRFLSRWDEGEQPFPERIMHTLQPSLSPPAVPCPPPAVRGPFTLLYLGRLSPEKGIERLIGAMSLLRGKRVRLCVAGTGYADYVDSLQRLAVERGVDAMIDWKGWNPDVWPLMAACHAGICVSPREEPFSMASLEFMAAGRAQIVPPTGAFGEYMNVVAVSSPVLDGFTAASAPAGLPDAVRLPALTETAIAEGVMELASRREVCAAIGRAAGERFALRPSADAAMERLARLYTGADAP